MRRLLLLATTLVTACAAGTPPNAPSLLPRAIERRGDAEPVIAAQTVALDAAFDAQIAVRVAAFDAAARAFETARPGLTRDIERAKGAGEGSDRWLEGQTAIGQLQQTRTAADGAMADLEELAIERAAAGSPHYPALDTAIATAQAELNRQAEIEARLKAVVGA